MRLPPLPALRFFEAAGRHLSFKTAAEELNVTPSAVSHGVAALEQTLGVSLFVRETRRIALTPAGADYLAYVSEAFALIAVGTQRLPSRSAERRISITCAPSLAARWLVPRLGDFRARWPDVSVLVDASRRQARCPLDALDIAVRYARAPLAGPQTWIPLFGERLLPVCAPGFLARWADAEGRCDLGRTPLIHVTTVSEDWAAWAERAGVAGLDLTGLDMAGLDVKRGLSFDAINMALDAAAAGLGVAMGRRPLADAELAAGRLVPAGWPAVASAGSYWLVCAESADARPELTAFQRWLIEQAAAFAAGA